VRTERTYRAEPRSVVVLIAAADSARDSSKGENARRRSAMRVGHQGLQNGRSLLLQKVHAKVSGVWKRQLLDV
jgi:hypothetical protein